MFWRWVNRFGAVVGLFGFAFAIYAYANCLPSRRLTFYADPASALIVKSGQTSKIVVTVDGKPLTTDVVAAQIVLWNAGNLPIKPEHIRQAITIQTVPSKPILDPTFRSITPNREKIINARIDTVDALQGRVRISWDILEQDDGFQIQIIFAGSADTRLEATGVLEGQNRIAILSVTPKDWFYKVTIYGFGISILALIPIGAVAYFFPRSRPYARRLASVLLVCLCLCVLGIPFRILALHFQRPIPTSLATPGLAEQLHAKTRALMDAPF